MGYQSGVSGAISAITPDTTKKIAGNSKLSCRKKTNNSCLIIDFHKKQNNETRDVYDFREITNATCPRISVNIFKN